MKQYIKSIAIGAALFALGGVGCGGEEAGPLDGVDSLIILQRPKRNDSGDIFQYTSYQPGARLVQLSPPTADGTLTTICCDKAGTEFSKVDISGYDISFDAKSIVFSARLAENQRYGLFLLQLADGSVDQIKTDPLRDYVNPIFVPGDKILFMSNAVVERGAPQHRDEYERGVTTQLGRINLDGTNEELGPRNLSHRTSPTLMSDGRVMFTQWDHLGDENSGHLMRVTPDMQELREGFGKEGTGVSNSVLKAREISAGRFVAIATSRDRTLTAGSLIDIRLGSVENHDGNVSAGLNQSEKNATVRLLSPDVPRDNRLSAPTVGRYYDAYPLNSKDKPDLLVSWADGPVESGVLATAGVPANFGIYLYDSSRQQRRPILDDPTMWDIFAMPLRTRSAPNIIGSAQQDPKLMGSTLIGSLDVYQSSLHTFKDGEIFGVRVMEGFSSEEGFPENFGTPRQEGHALLGVARVQSDRSWSAKIPANVPVHLQTIDVFGMSLFTEPVWFSGRAGEARVCGGCHEDRTKTVNVLPGVLEGFVTANNSLMADVLRNNRINTNPSQATDIVGVGWSTQIQPILNTSCVAGCHDAQNSAGVAGYTITDPKTGAMVTVTLDLSDAALPANLGVAAGGGAYSRSYFSMAGPDMEAIEKGGLMISGNFKTYMKPLDARGSIAIQKLNPKTLFPTPSGTRAFAGQGHLIEQGKTDLLPRDMYMFILAADMGMNYYARENNPRVNTY